MQSLAGDKVQRVAGIVNGTTNFILSAMDADGDDYDTVLAEAGDSDTPRSIRRPTSRATTQRPRPRSSRRSRFHTRVTAADVYREGITKVTAADLAAALVRPARSSCFRSASAWPGPTVPGRSRPASTRR